LWVLVVVVVVVLVLVVLLVFYLKTSLPVHDKFALS
jgi:hypothetical protein